MVPKEERLEFVSLGEFTCRRSKAVVQYDWMRCSRERIADIKLCHAIRGLVIERVDSFDCKRMLYLP